jgi:hypothetical protein
MRKNKFQQPEPQILILEAVPPDDPSLPPARGRTCSPGKPTLGELVKLDRTRSAEGLVPERYSPQHWQCVRCGSIHAALEAARECHDQPPNQVQLCHKCGKRIADCVCTRRFS